METLYLDPILTEDEGAALEGTFLTERHVRHLVNTTTRVVARDTGKTLAVLVRGALDPALCAQALDAMRDAATTTDNRGAAAGFADVGKEELASGPVGKRSRLRYQFVKQDGSLSKTVRAVRLAKSGIIGFFDRNPRYPYCRTTAYTLKHAERFAAALPFIRQVSDTFGQHAPEGYQRQMEVIQATHPDFYIPGTAFTTVTVNKNWQTAVHKDAGDYEKGFGVMTAFTSGGFGGCYLVLPRYGVGFDFRTTDVLLCDVHEWHGNTPIRPTGAFERISSVFYYRAGMLNCGSQHDELARAASKGAKAPTE